MTLIALKKKRPDGNILVKRIVVNDNKVINTACVRSCKNKVILKPFDLLNISNKLIFFPVAVAGRVRPKRG